MAEIKPPEERDILSELTDTSQKVQEGQSKDASAQDVDLSEEDMAMRFEAAVGDQLLALIMADGQVDPGEINKVLELMGFSPEARGDAMLIGKVTDMLIGEWQTLHPDGKSIDDEEKQAAVDAAMQIAQKLGNMFTSAGVQGKHTQAVSQSTPGMDASKGQGQGF